MSELENPLSKTERRERERQARELEQDEVVALEPLFPFTVFEFDPTFFGVDGNPPDKIRAANSESS